jgi:hypothetical protein
MELTNQQAIALSLEAADRNAEGRKEWIQEDVDFAKMIYEKLKPVQKTDETPTEEPDAATN